MNLKSLKLILRGAAILLAVAVVCGTAAGFVLWKKDMLPKQDAAEKVWWRARLFGRKSTGRLPDLSWSELIQMTRREGGFGLERFVSWGTSLSGSVYNPFMGDEDLEAAEKIFTQRCSLCHGAQGGGGGIGPTLNHAGYKHGDSDLAVYKVIRDGVPNTAMVAQAMSFTERWQLVGYVKSLMANATPQIPRPKLHIKVTSERLGEAGSKSDEWLTYSGSYDGHRFVPLAEINRSNVSKLRPLWVRQFETDERDAIIEATPLVVDGTIFLTLPPSSVVALDARTGQEIWRYSRMVSEKVITCCGRYNRGLAILGRRLFLNTLDAHVLALDADNGHILWDQVMADNTDGYSMTGAPLVAGGAVVVGVSGADLGIRGFLAALDPETGRELWRFHTIPGPGEPGNETWSGDSWKTGGGATWVPGSYDKDLDLVYWGVGNPAPDYSGDTRLGDNLYSNSVIAIHPGTGKLAWYFQFTPHDEHDWDSNQTPILAELPIGGVNRKVLLWANRNGFYYVLDRVTGQFLVGTPFVDLNWTDGLDAKGRPRLAVGGSMSEAGRLTRPAYIGGTLWQNAAFSPKHRLVFVPASEGASVFTKSTSRVVRDPTNHATPFLASQAITSIPVKLVVRALDATTGEKKWESFAPPLDTTYRSGLLATGGNLVLGTEGGYAFALDLETGKELWRLYLGGSTQSAPISFTLDGKQVITFVGGRAMFLFGL